MSVACPNENEILARIARTLPVERAAEIDAHLDHCSSCRMLVAEAALEHDRPRGKGGGAATFEPGEVVADRYVVTRWIASGGMGEVYEVHDRTLDQQVALKTVIATISDDAHALARLKAEVRMARCVTHENVCRAYDLGVHHREGEQIAFLTMELLRGTTLKERLRKSGPIDVTAALPIVAQMVAALAHAHAAGIVHRDFKSDNVMLVQGESARTERVVVMDFGLARESLVAGAQPLTPHSRTVFGTLDYMSPEQVEGKPASAASDIYSLGIVLYELLTGRLPFQEGPPLARALRRVTDKAPRLDKLLPQIDPAVSNTVARCLEKLPDRRFESAAQVLQAMQGDHRALIAPRRRAMSVLTYAVLGIGIGFLTSAALHSTHAGQAVPRTAATPLSKIEPPAPIRSPIQSETVLSTSTPSLTAVSSVVPARSGNEPERALKKRAPLPAGNNKPKPRADSNEALPPPSHDPPPAPSGDALMNPFSAHPAGRAP